MKILYTLTDEAPALATRSLLPILSAFCAAAGIEIEPRDISLAGRILAQFPERLSEEQRAPDALEELGELARTAEANIVKLPNISASVPQLKAAIKELHEKGYEIPDYPEDPADEEQRETRARYDRVKGSAVNPVLRQGNSDRRAAAPVKAYARKHPHSMGEWSSDSRSHVSTMSDGDFRSTERSVTVSEPRTVRIEHVGEDGTTSVLHGDLELQAGEVIDAAVMRIAALREFLTEQIADAREQGVLYSVHLKATMMKVSDPIIFGHAVSTFFPDLSAPGWKPNDGLAALPEGTEIPFPADGPPLAMVDSDRGITNLHVPSDVIIDASMPAAIRSSGQMWNAQGEQQDAKFVIPDHSYAALYAETVEHCREHGAFDPATMGATSNVGLMAQAAEEYGSHDKTFEIPSPGAVRVVDEGGETLLEHEVDAGDIWRMCQTKDAAITDWVRLAVERASATRFALERARRGEDTITVTGNVLRDYLTDLFPILELGTSAKMLSIVPLLSGGGLFETGAGGSAPKHVQQFLKENHLRWDSLGEFLAFAPSLELFAHHADNPRAKLLAEALDRATGRVLEEGRSPSRKSGELDNRGSHFYLALYWAQELAGQSEDQELAERFNALAERLAADEARIVEKLSAVQGEPVDIGGYYLPDSERANAAMRPSQTFNEALAELYERVG